MFGVFSNKGRYIEHWQEYFYLANGITAADEGRAVTLDTSGPKKVRLAAAGEVVIGRLEVVEDRKTEGALVGTVSLKGLGWFPTGDGVTVALGSTVEGASVTIGGVARNGGVRAAATPNPRDNFVAMTEAGRCFVIWQ